MMNNEIKEIIVVTGHLKNISPMSIGSGRDEQSDNDIIRDWDGIPFIPGATLAGVLRHRLLECAVNWEMEKKIRYLFGEKIPENNQKLEKKMVHSSIIFYDLFPKSDSIPSVDLRDGVKIHPKYRTAIKKSKYDFEILNPGIEFHFKLEFHLRNEDEMFFEIIRLLVHELMNGSLHIGGKANRGMGRIQLSEPEIFRFKTHQKEDVMAFIHGTNYWNEFKDHEFLKNHIPKKAKFVLKATFKIPYSILIRSYNINPNAPDTSHISSNGKDIIPGTSWTGAIRHGMRNILEDLGISQMNTENILNTIFGKVDEQEKLSVASLVRIYESEIQHGKRLTYTRNKVDRFTGGVVETALFDEEAIYGGETVLEMDLSSLRKKHEDKFEGYVGLLLLVLRDLGNGIQPIGGDANIGKGILELQTVHLNNEPVPFEDDSCKYYKSVAGLLKEEN